MMSNHRSIKEVYETMKTYQRSHIATENDACYDTNEVVGDSMNNKKVGKFIAQARRKKKLTQAQLGEMLGLSDKAISKWERGINGPDVSVLQSLSDALGVSIAEILLGQEIKTTITNEEVNNYTLSGIGFYKKIFRRRYTRIIGILIGIIILLSVGFSYVYLFTNYDQVQVYELNSKMDNFTFDGLIVKNQKENSILITSFSYEEDIKGTDKEPLINSIVIEFNIGKVILYKKKEEFRPQALSEVISKSSILISENKKLNNYSFDYLKSQNLFLKIKYTIVGDKEKVEQIFVPIEIKEKFSNNKLVY